MCILSRCTELALAGLVVLGLGTVPAKARAVTIDFDDAPGATHGRVLTDWAGIGGTGLGARFSASLLDGGTTFPVLFDAGFPGRTQDTDLIQPFRFDPTSRLVNSHGSPYNPGFLLIAQNDSPQAPNRSGDGFLGCGAGLCTHPNDAIGGTLTIRLDQPVTFHGLDLFDATRSNIRLFDGAGALLYRSAMPSVFGASPPDDRLYGSFLTGPVSGVRTIAVAFANGRGVGDSGALDRLRVELVPEPSSWALMILGFGLVGWRASRSRRADRPSLAA